MSLEWRKRVAEMPPPALSPEIIARTTERLRGIISDPESYMDEGGAAHVYRLPAGACMKVMRPHNESTAAGIKPGNSLEKEAEFLERLTGFAVAGTRSPSYLAAVRDENLSALLMEEIEGANLQKILAGEVELPPSFSHHDFFISLERYLQALHDDRKIVHGDLEPRNIMLDFKTGLPCIIDFGRSVDTGSLSADARTRLERDEWTKLEILEGSMHSLGKGLTK